MWVQVCPDQPDASGCPNAVWLAWHDLGAFQISQLDPAVIAQAFGAGFILMGTGFAIGRGVRALLSMVGS